MVTSAAVPAVVGIARIGTLGLLVGGKPFQATHIQPTRELLLIMPIALRILPEATNSDQVIRFPSFWNTSSLH